MSLYICTSTYYCIVGSFQEFGSHGKVILNHFGSHNDIIILLCMYHTIDVHERVGNKYMGHPKLSIFYH